MRFKKGAKGTTQWEHMLVHGSDVYLGVHYYDGRMTREEKKIIENHLRLCAIEINALVKMKTQQAHKD